MQIIHNKQSNEKATSAVQKCYFAIENIDWWPSECPSEKAH
jgi:hypothetical protein